MDYENNTLNGYKDLNRAKLYKHHQTNAFSWARLVTFFEQKLIKKELNCFNWDGDHTLLDIPCGTGILGKTIKNFPFKIVASDISLEMMSLASEEYNSDNLISCVQCDITDTGLQKSSFDCVIVLGFLHRVPADIKIKAIKEVSVLTKNIAIFSCSVDGIIQRAQRKAIKLFFKSYKPASNPVSRNFMIQKINEAGLTVLKIREPVPFLSSHTIFICQK
jgi:ubiquinone/menaquinone biosynthesis C-methylase UbiE